MTEYSKSNKYELKKVSGGVRRWKKKRGSSRGSKLKDTLPYQKMVYRGVSQFGGGHNVGKMGVGIYVSEDKNVANAFAKQHSMGGRVLTYRLRPNLNLLNASSGTYIDVKRSWGLEYWQTPPFEGVGKAISDSFKRLGYDGVKSHDPFDGILIFDSKNLVLV